MVKPKFVINQADVENNIPPILIGGQVTVNCIKSVQLFTKDIWDQDPNDNMLTIRCRPDKMFDVPSSSQMPDCLAQCPAVKPSPPSPNKIVLDSRKTSPTERLWEREELWYSCTDRKDGIAIPGENGTFEGSDDRSIVYVCDENGEYSIPTQGGNYLYPKCIPRRKQVIKKFNNKVTPNSTFSVEVSMFGRFQGGQLFEERFGHVLQKRHLEGLAELDQRYDGKTCRPSCSKQDQMWQS